MELVVTSALALAGYQMNKTREIETVVCDKKTNNNSIIMKDLYNSDQLNLNSKNRNSSKNSSKNSSNKNSSNKNSSNKNSSNKNSSNKNSSNKNKISLREGFDNIKKSRNDYADQFNVLEFDSSGPSSMNYNDIDNDTSYSSFNDVPNMTYNITGVENFQHNNMNHHTSARDMPINLEPQGSIMQDRLGIFTGTDDNFTPKKESAPLFKPIKDLTYINGAPNNIDILQDRYLPSSMKNNENLPFTSKLKVVPGLDGRNQDGLYGNTRFLPKTSNELRNKNNPIESYPGLKIESVKKGELRGINPTVESRKPMTYKINKDSEMYPTMAHYREQKSRGNINPSFTNRTQSIYHSGPAKSSNAINMPDDQRAKIRESDRIAYTNDGITRNVTGDVKGILQNKKSINLPTTRREATANKNRVGGAGVQNDKKSYTINRKDIPLTTLRQMMIDNPNMLGVTATQQNQKGYAFDKNMVLPTTIKETTVSNTRTGGLIGHIKQSKSYNPNDKPGVTIKQTTVGNNRTGDFRIQEGSYAFNPNDKPGVTIKQTTVGNTRTGDLRMQDGSYAFNPNDKPGVTIKQTTIGNTRTGDLRMQDGSYAFNPNDKPGVTIKQTTVGNTRTGDLRMQDGSYAFNPNDKPAVTIKQTTVGNTRTGDLRMQDGSYAFNPNDKPGVTIKQTTVGNTRTGDLRMQDGSYAFNPNDKPGVTIKQTTVGNTRTGDVRMQEGSYAFNPNDKPGVTIKQTTIGNTRTGDVRMQEGSYAFNPNDKPDITMKDTLVHKTRIGGAELTEGTYARDLNDTAKPTMKQTTVEKTRTGGLVNPTDGGTGYLTNKMVAPVTHRQTMHKSHAGGVYDSQGKGYLTNKMNAPTTTKQTTLLQDYTGGMKHELDKQRVYDDVLNMSTNQEKEKLAKGRKPTQRSYDKGPNKKSVNVNLKTYINNQRDGAPSRTLNQSMENNLSSVYSRNRNELNELNECSGFRLDPSTLSALKDNPYVNNIMFNANQINNPYEGNENC
jgi:lysozyme family protein